MRRPFQLVSGFVAAASQIISVGYIFWIIKSELGAAQLGLWALLLSSLSVVNVSGFGLGQAMIHFTQQAKNELENRLAFEQYFRTAITLTLIGLVILISVIFIPARYFLVDLAGSDQRALVETLLPIMILSLGAALLNRLMISTLNGQDCFWIGQCAILIGSALYVGLGTLWVGPYQLIGVAYAHLAMTVGVLILSWASVVLIRIRENRSIAPLWPFGLYRHTFRPMIKLGLSFQVTSILMLLLEPLARFTLGYVGGLSLVGYYEMANRLAVTPRELISRPAAYYSGQFAALNRSNKPDMMALYDLTIKRFKVLGILGFVGLLAIALPVADYWVQERQPFFFFSVLALGIAMAVNIPAIVPWYLGVGIGDNRYNLRSILIMALGMVCVCACAKVFKQPYLIPFGVSASMICGHIYLLRAILRQNRRVSRV